MIREIHPIELYWNEAEQTIFMIVRNGQAFEILKTRDFVEVSHEVSTYEWRFTIATFPNLQEAQAVLKEFPLLKNLGDVQLRMGLCTMGQYASFPFEGELQRGRDPASAVERGTYLSQRVAAFFRFWRGERAVEKKHIAGCDWHLYRA
jgi:hypothetical protein